MQQLQWKEQGKEEDHVKDGGKRLKRTELPATLWLVEQCLNQLHYCVSPYC
jgi:hypothetical protein